MSLPSLPPRASIRLNKDREPVRTGFSAHINVMIGAVKKVGRPLVRDFNEVEQLQVSMKGTADFVSNADMKTEAALREILQKARPDFGLLMEETGAHGPTDANSRWIVDPLDGTTNFLHGIPHFAISVGLEHQGEIIAAVVYNPVTDELYFADKGRGAFLSTAYGERRLRVSARRKLDESVVTTGIPHCNRGDHAAYLKQLSAMMAKTAGIRRFGAASLDLAYVAAGRCECFWETGLKPWDVAAGILLVREAGGYVSLPGSTGSGVNETATILSSGNILATNDRMHQDFSGVLREASA